MSEIIFYRSEDGNIKIDAFFEEETLWMSQKQMAEVFETSKQNVSYHLKKIFEE